jgi:hypothetical protein
VTLGPFGRTALDYWAAGWRPIPLPFGCKTPPPAGFTGANGAEPSYADVMAWTDGPEAAGNVALRMRPDVIGLDVDAYGGKSGASTLARAVEMWGPLPPSASSTSRSDGVSRITFYRVTSGLHLPGEIGPGVEIIQARHRYAVVWPSRHPSGLDYAWSTGTMPPASELPRLPDLWQSGLTSGRVLGEWSKASLGKGEAEAWIRSHGGGACRAIDRALTSSQTTLSRPSGSRHDACCDAVHHLVMLGAEGHGGVAGALRMLYDTWCQVATVGESARTEDVARAEWARMVEGAISEALAVGQAGEDPCAVQDERARADREAVNFLAAPVLTLASSLEPLTEFEVLVRQEVQRQHVRDEASRRLRIERNQGTADPETVEAIRAQLLTSQQLDNIKDLVPVVEGWLYRETAARIFGASGSYKSFLAVDIACAVATGRQWFGYAVKPGAVIYVVAEGAGGIRQRVRAWETEHCTIAEGLSIYPEPVQIMNDEWWAFAEVTKSMTPALVIFDTQARCTVGIEENSNTDMGGVIERVERLARESGACAVLIHHTGHGQTRGRGASAVYAALETEIGVTRSADLLIEVEQAKQKNSQEIDTVKLALRAVESGAGPSLVVTNVEGDPLGYKLKDTETKVLDYLTEVEHIGASGAVLVEATDIPKSSLYRVLNTLIDRKLIFKDGTKYRARRRPNDRDAENTS